MWNQKGWNQPLGWSLACLFQIQIPSVLPIGSGRIYHTAKHTHSSQTNPHTIKHHTQTTHTQSAPTYTHPHTDTHTNKHRHTLTPTHTHTHSESPAHAQWNEGEVDMYTVRVLKCTPGFPYSGNKNYIYRDGKKSSILSTNEWTYSGNKKITFTEMVKNPPVFKLVRDDFAKITLKLQDIQRRKPVLLKHTLPVHLSLRSWDFWVRQLRHRSQAKKMLRDRGSGRTNAG